MSPGRYLSMFRLHASTCFALLPVMAAIALANVPGEYVLFGRDFPVGAEVCCEHGWPCTWLVRKGLHGAPEGLWDITADVCRFDGTALATDMGLAMLILATLAVALEWRRRMRHRIWQFTLAEIFLTTLAVSCFMTWYASQRRSFTRGAEAAQSSDIAWVTEPAFPSWVREAVGDERLSTLGIMRAREIELELPGADPARDDDMAGIRAIVNCQPQQVWLFVPRYGAIIAPEQPFRGADYLRTLQCLRQLVLERADDAVCACFDGLRDLRILIIQDEEAILSPEGAARLADLRQLRQLRASRRWLGDAGVAALGSLDRLETLSLDGANDDDLAHLARLRKLRLLELPNATVTDSGLASLADLRRLEQLTVQSTRVTGAGFNALACLPRLHTIDLAGSGITDDGLVGIGGLGSLVFLNLQFTPLTGSGLHHLAALRHLRSLQLATTELDDRGFATLPEFPRLEFLDVSDTRITEMSLGALNSLTELCELSLSKTKVDSLERLDFNRLSHIERLDIDQTWVPDTDCERVEMMHPQFKFGRNSNKASGLGGMGTRVSHEIDLTGPSVGDAQLHELVAVAGIRCVRLASSRISGGGLARLAQFRDLEGIDFAGTSIDDAGLSHLGALPRLKYLDIAYTKVTDEGLKRLAHFPALAAVSLDPSQINASSVSLLKRNAKLKVLRITRLRAPWGGHYGGAADFEEFIQFLRRDLPAITIYTATRSPDGSTRCTGLIGCGF
ncbi:MAG TPA: hypothetical protein VFW87_00345 [Pirellulales bacterium]|nr:hypothetical protein [Pirellulales bacterium]